MFVFNKEWMFPLCSELVDFESNTWLLQYESHSWIRLYMMTVEVALGAFNI